MMIREDDLVAMTVNGVEWYGYVEQFIEPNFNGIKVRWHPNHASWHNYDDLTVVDYPEKKKEPR